jgi:hypothetical protein
VTRDVNPFVYSHPLAPEDVIDRDRETGELLANAVGGHFVRLYAPRKYGKTSLLRRTLRDGELHEGLVPVMVDLYRAASVADVAIRLERAYSRQLKGTIRQRVERFLQRTGIGLSLGAYGISAQLQMQPRLDPLPAVHALLDLPLRLELSGAHRAYIVFDEFQDIDRIPGFDGLLRSHIQHHGEIASYVFAGSEPGLMRQLFESRQRPLYGSAVPVRLGRLENRDLGEYIDDRFRQTGRSVGEALQPLLDAAAGHPQRAMMLAHRLWQQVARRAAADLGSWEAAHAATLRELEPEFDAQWRGYDASQQKTLRAIVAGDGRPYSGEVLRRLALTKSMVSRALPRLQARADIEQGDGGYRIVDPLLDEWIARLNSGS